MVFFGSAKRQNGALWSRFLRLVGYGFGPYPDFSDRFRRGILGSPTFCWCSGFGPPGFLRELFTPTPSGRYLELQLLAHSKGGWPSG